MIGTQRSCSAITRRSWTHAHNCHRPFTTSEQSVGTADIVKGPSLLRTSVTTRPRPSLLHLPGLRSLPVWTQNSAATDNVTRVAYNDPTVTSVVQHLESHWPAIWAEYQAVAPNLASDYQPDTEHATLHEGTWDWHSFMSKGIVNDARHSTGIGTTTRAVSFATHFPVTAAVLAHLSGSAQLFEGTPFGYAFFSTLHGASKIAPHSAPMNLRLRVHLALSVPESTDPTRESSTRARPACGLCIGGVTRTWQTGQCLVIDDAYEHDVWNDTTQTRVVLLVDIWHPDIAMAERRDIVAMFDAAKEKGWLST